MECLESKNSSTGTHSDSRNMIAMASSSSEIVTDLSPLLKVHKDGTVERLSGITSVPPSPEDPTTGVSSKDIKISSTLSARLYLPKMTDPSQTLPILIYFHGGAFCMGCTSSVLDHNYISLLVSEANALAVSVGYRIAPEHPLPAAYEDSWAALQWVASHVVENSDTDKEPWLINHGNFNKIHIVGDSAGGNIVHNIAMKAGQESLPGDPEFLGGILCFPYFWGSKCKIANDSTLVNGLSLVSRIWLFAYPTAPNGIDNPMINPLADDAPSLSGIGCSRLLVCVAEKDDFREPTLLYVETLKNSGWKGEAALVDFEGEGHCFRLFNSDSDKARSLINHLVSFINA